MSFGENASVGARQIPENADILRSVGSRLDPSMRAVESIDAVVTGASADDPAQVVSALREMVRIAPEDKAPALALAPLLAGIERSQGRLPEAVAALERALALDRKNYLIPRRLGALTGQMGRLDLAHS